VTIDASARSLAVISSISHQYSLDGNVDAQIYHQRSEQAGYLALYIYSTLSRRLSQRFIRPLLSARHIYTLIWPNNFLSLTGYWLETISTKLACSYAAKLREMTARRRRRRRESATTWRRRFPKYPRIVAVVRNKLLDIWHYLRQTGTRSFHRETNRRRTNTSARLHVTLLRNLVQEAGRDRSKQFARI